MVGPLVVTVHPLIRPLSAAVGARPVGSGSVTVTAPAVDPDPMLLTVRVYVAAASPWWKLPVWLLAMVKSAGEGGLKSTVSTGRFVAVLFSLVSNSLEVSPLVSLSV